MNGLIKTDYQYISTILAIFTEFKQQKKILDFFRADCLYTREIEVMTVLVVLSPGRYKCFYFQKQAYVGQQIQLVEDNLMSVSFCMTDSCSAKSARPVLLSYIHQYLEGWKREAECIERILSIFEARMKMNPLSIFKGIHASSYEEDIHMGIDAWILYSDKSVPLQIKSSEGGLHKHKEKYPDIPALAYKKDMSTQDIMKQIRTICSQYSQKFKK